MSLGAINKMLKYARDISDNIVRVNQDVITAAKPSMIKANHDQLDNGQLNTGDNITPFYSASYAKKKGFEIPDLLDKGDFRDRWDVVQDGNSFLWGSNDEKTAKLEAKYGGDIFGLNKDNAEQEFNKIDTKVYEYINRSARKCF